MTDISLSGPSAAGKTIPPGARAMRLPTQWLGVAPFIIFALMFLILPTLYLIIGAFQDAEAQWFLVRDSAEELRATAPIETLLAMGRMAHELRLRQEHEHAVFAQTWARFYAKENRARFAAMVAGR